MGLIAASIVQVSMNKLALALWDRFYGKIYVLCFVIVNKFITDHRISMAFLSQY